MGIAKLIDEKSVYTAVRAANLKSLQHVIADSMFHRIGMEKPAAQKLVAQPACWQDAYMQDGLAIVPVPCETTHTRLLFFILGKPVPLEADDHIPIEMVGVLCYPAQEAATRLQAMASISRRLRNQDLRKQLRGVHDADAAYVLLVRSDQEDQAA
jgi:hypothetical protein